MDSDMHVPFKIAVGFTVPVYGLAQRTRERIKKRDSHVDWWLYKERHLVENYFLKLKVFRRIATRYDKLASTFLGFVCIVSILIWLK